MACLLMNSSHHHSTPNLMSSSGVSGGGGSAGGSSAAIGSGGGGPGVTGSSSVHDTLAAIVVPNELKTLIRLIMRVFYSFELYLCIEMLLIYPCLKEEDLAELLRLDLKTVHQYLINLKKEKFLKEQQKMEKLPDGKFSPHSFFHIDYKMLVNVIKYKLDRIRIQIEVDENQSSTRPQFKCSECGKTYSDLDTKDIFLTMRCTLCNAEVEEDPSSLPKQSARNLMNKFNTQMKPIFDLLSRVEHIRLADCVLRPEPVDMSYVLERMRTSSSSGSGAGQNGLKPGANGLNGKGAAKQYGDRWSGDKTRNTDLLSKTQISVNLDAGEAGAATKRVAKELPSIIVQNRVRDEELDSRDSILLNSVRQAADETINNSVVDSSSTFAKPNPPSSSSATSSSTLMNGGAASLSSGGGAQSSALGDSGSTLASASSQSAQNLEVVIMQKLLKHEKKASQAGGSSADSPGSSTADSSSTSNSPKTMSDPVSSITITKKRPMDSVVDSSAIKQMNGVTSNQSGEIKNGFYKNGVRNLDENDIYTKKRKLNNGEIMNGNHYHMSSLYLKRNHSDGSASENSSETGSDDFYNYNSGGDDDEMNGLEYGLDDDHYPPDEDDEYIPRVYVQNRAIRFDRVTPRLIKLMAPNERDEYINICKQLYTEIYEI